MPRSQSRAPSHSPEVSSMRELDEAERSDKRHLGGKESKRRPKRTRRKPASQTAVTGRYLNWGQRKQRFGGSQKKHLDPSDGMDKSLDMESEEDSYWNPTQKSEKRSFRFSETDLSGDGRALEDLGNRREDRKGLVISDSSTALPRVAGSEQWQKGAGNSEASQVELPPCAHTPGPEDPDELECQNLVSNSGRLESRPLKQIEYPTRSIPDTQNQTSSSVFDAQQNIPNWAEDILNTYLERVGFTDQKFCSCSAPVSEDHCESSTTLQSQSRNKTSQVTRSRLEVIITLTKEGSGGPEGAHGHAGGLVSTETGGRGTSQALMAESGTSNPSEPAEPVAEECQRNAANDREPPLAGFGGQQAQSGGQSSQNLYPYVSPRPRCRDPGFSRFLPLSPAAQAIRKPELQKLASLLEPLQQAGGLVVSCKQGEGDTKIMSTNSKIVPEIDLYPSSVEPSQPAGNANFTQTANTTTLLNTNGGLGDGENGNSENSLQPRQEGVKHKIYNLYVKDERFVNGVDPTTTNDSTNQKILSLLDNPTWSGSLENQSPMNSLIFIETIGQEPSQQPGKDPRRDGSDAWKNVNSCGSAQQISALHQQSPDQNGRIAETVPSLNTGESGSQKVKLDSAPYSSLVSLQEGLLQNTVNFPKESMKVQTAETLTLTSQGTLLQKPTDNSEKLKIESSSMVNPEPQQEALKFSYESTGLGGNRVQHLHLPGSPLNQLSPDDTVFQSNMKNSLTNALDDSDSQSEIDGFVDTIRNLDVPVLLSRNKNARNQRPHSLTSPFSTLPPIEEDQTNPLLSPSSSITEEPPETPEAAEPVAVDGKLLPSSPTQPVLEPPQKNFSKILTDKASLTPGQMMKMQLEEKSEIGPQRASVQSSIVFQSSFSGRTKLDDTASSEGTEALIEDSIRSRISNSFLYTLYHNPTESFSSRSLDLSMTKKQISAAPATLQNRLQRSLSQENVPTTTEASDKLSTLTSLAPSSNESLGTRRTNLPFSIPEKLIPGFTCRSDSGQDLRKNRISLPSKKKPKKLTAFPDGWNLKPKEQEKIIPRPGKIVIFDKPNLSGFKREISCDVADCMSWPFPAVISIKVIRGCWVIYEKPEYKGKKIFLAEEEVELADPWAEEKEEDQDSKPPPTKPVVIGSLRRAVRDYTIPQISLFPDSNGEGRKLSFYSASEDIRIFGYPPKTTSIIVNSGLWLVYSEPFFEGQLCALEVGGYRTLQEWGAERAQVGSLLPLQMSGPRVERPYEPKLSIFEKTYYVGRYRDVRGDSSDFLSRYPSNGAPLSNAGSIKVYGGIWVGYSKEGFRGHQYLLEEGEYPDWRSWGGYDEDLKSLRVIRADFSKPLITLYPENNCEGEDSATAVDSVADMEATDSGDIIQSINVLSGVWVAYEGANYSGAQYIVEKGIYRNPQEWGAQSCRIGSLQPILQVEPSGQQFRLKIQIFSEYDFNGRCLEIEENKMGIPKEFKLQSCRVLSGSWALYEGQDYNGRVFVVSEGEYPDLQSMGCRMTTHIRCVKTIPYIFSEPLITLHGLENFEGKEIELESEMKNLTSDGYNNQVLSLHVHGGIWVIFEYSNFRGRQVLLDPIEISNWPKYSSFTRIGSLMPIIQKQRYFTVKNQENGGLLSILPCEEDIKSGRVIIAPESKDLEQLWFYEKGMLKPKFAPDMSLQTIGTVGDTGSKVVIWSDTRIPKHCWTFEFSGTIQSLLYEGFVLSIKGGKSYDQDSGIICKHDDQNPVQQWEIQML